jgi:type VI secretion system protein ImpK
MSTPNTAAAPVRRPENLALLFQEPLTVVVRLRSNRQRVSDAESFRHQIRQTLATAAQQARHPAGYAADTIKMATFAVVGFLDESILNAQNPVFADWPRKPLQEELFGTHMAGEVFFQNLQALLARDDSAELADLLEVHYLCLLLGFRGRYSTGPGGDLQAFMRSTAEKIRRIRGRAPDLSPSWALPAEAVRPAKDTWTRRFALIALACFVITVALFAVFKISLHSGASEIQAIAAQAK